MDFGTSSFTGRRRGQEPGDVAADGRGHGAGPAFVRPRQNRHGLRQRLPARPHHVPLQTRTAHPHRLQIQVGVVAAAAAVVVVVSFYSLGAES